VKKSLFQKALSFTALACATLTLGSAAFAAPAKSATFAVTGMHCEGCSMGLTQSSKRWPGVKSANINFAKKRAFITYDPQVTNPSKLQAHFKKTGFPAKPIK
jgi:copper chaperone CopZ